MYVYVYDGRKPGILEAGWMVVNIYGIENVGSKMGWDRMHIQLPCFKQLATIYYSQPYIILTPLTINGPRLVKPVFGALLTRALKLWSLSRLAFFFTWKYLEADLHLYLSVYLWATPHHVVSCGCEHTSYHYMTHNGKDTCSTIWCPLSSFLLKFPL